MTGARAARAEAGDGGYAAGLDQLAPAVRLREIALRLIAERGPGATSLRMIAAAAGVSTGAVMHHYRSKADLEAAVLEAVLGRVEAAVTGAGLHRPTREALRERRQVYEAFLADNPEIAGYLRQVYLEGGPSAARVFQAGHEMQRQQMEQMVAAGLARELPDPEIGLLLYHVLTISTLLLRPLLEGVGGLDLADPAVRARFIEAEIDLLTRPHFENAQPQGSH